MCSPSSDHFWGGRKKVTGGKRGKEKVGDGCCATRRQDRTLGFSLENPKVRSEVVTQLHFTAGCFDVLLQFCKYSNLRLLCCDCLCVLSPTLKLYAKINSLCNPPIQPMILIHINVHISCISHHLSFLRFPLFLFSFFHFIFFNLKINWSQNDSSL